MEEDTLHHRQLRLALVEKIRHKGIAQPAVLNAIARVPRHLFIDPPVSPAEAYEDKAIAIGQGQAISQPYTVAYQTQLLEIKPQDKVLEIGTGSGYQSAVLFEMGADVYSVERRQLLHLKARARLLHLGYAGIHLFFKDGSEGLQEQAPFDKVIVTAGASGIPPLLLEELKPGGMLVIPVGERVQKMLKVIKTDSGTVIREYDDFNFVKFLTGTEER